MHLLIDVRAACDLRRAGKGQWTYQFVSELLRRDGVQVTLLTDFPVPQEWSDQTVVTFPSGIRWHVRAAAFAKAQTDIDYYVSPTSYITPFLLGVNVRCIPIVHDMIAFRSEPHDKKATVIERLLLPLVAKRATHICTVSMTTKNDLLERFSFLGDQTVTPIFAGPFEENPPLSQSDGKTILCASTLCPRKNQKNLIYAYAALPADLRNKTQLVLIGGRGWHDADIVCLAERTEGVTWKGYVSDDEYSQMLSTCMVFALPSFYEGFGLSVLDAMQRGIPVVTSNRGSLAEVAGDAAKLVEPCCPGAIAMGLQEVLENADLRKNMIETGLSQATKFSWKRTVDLFLGVLQG